MAEKKLTPAYNEVGMGPFLGLMRRVGFSNMPLQADNGPPPLPKLPDDDGVPKHFVPRTWTKLL